MHRRETFEAPETPKRPGRRRRRITGTVIVGAVVLSGIGVGAVAASASPDWMHPGRHHHPHAWSLPPIDRDGFTFWSRPPRATSTPTASASGTPTVSASPTSTPSSSGTSSSGTTTVSDPGTYGTADHLFAADSPWNTPIPSDPAIDPDSAAISSTVLANPSLVVNLDLIAYGQPFYTATASTPRVTLGGRGGGIGPVPLDPSWTPNSGGDSKMNIIDPTTHTVFELDGFNAANRTVYWAVKHDYTTALGDGYPTGGELKGPTGSGMSQAAGAIRASDLQSGVIDHALSFLSSSPVAAFRYPASQSDGSGSGVGMEEGMRIQLDPSVDVDAISGLTPGERMIMKALQVYGAYCSDNGGGNDQAMGFYVEKPNASTQSIFDAAGLTKDWQVLSKIPRDKLRVLAASVTQRP